MATRVVGDVAVRIGVDAKRLNRGLQDSGRKVSRFGRDTESTAARIGRSTGRAITSIVALAAGVAVAANKAITALDGIAKTADRLGVTTGELQRLRFAAQSAGVEATTLDMAIQRFTRRAAEAAQGTGEAKAALEEMGISLTDNEGRMRSTTDLLADVADSMRGTENQADRIRLAFKLFDSEGVAMINMLDNGGAAFRRNMRAADAFGAVVEDSAVRAAEELRDEIDKNLSGAMANMQTALIEAGPLLLALSEALLGVARVAADVAGRISTVAAEIAGAAAAVRDFITAGEQGGGSAGRRDNRRNRNGTGTASDTSAATRPQGPRGQSIIRGGDGRLSPTDPRALAQLGPSPAQVAAQAAETARRQRLAPGQSPTDPNGMFLNQQSIDNFLRGRAAAAGDGEDSGGGGGGALAALMPSQEDLETLQSRFATALETAQAEYEKQREMVRSFREQGIGDVEELNQLEQDVEKAHAEKLLEIRRDMEEQRNRAVSGALGDLASLMQTGNEKLFKIGKAAAVAQAVVDGYSSAIAAWTKGMQIGGPPVAAAFLGASLVKTGALISSLKSASPGGSGGGAGAGGGAVSTTAAGGSGDEELVRREITVNLQGGLAGQATGVRDLLKNINDELGQGANLDINIDGAPA